MLRLVRRLPSRRTYLRGTAVPVLWTVAMLRTVQLTPRITNSRAKV